MMVKIVSGKLLSINGPSFSGKTYFTSKLTGVLAGLNLLVSNISFELVYVDGKTYKEMCNDYIKLAEDKLLQFDVVVAESTIIRLDKAFTICCMPSLESHKKNISSYQKEFGYYDAARRTYVKCKDGNVCFCDAELLRNQYNSLYIKDVNDIETDMTEQSIKDTIQKVIDYVIHK